MSDEKHTQRRKQSTKKLLIFNVKNDVTKNVFFH